MKVLCAGVAPEMQKGLARAGFFTEAGTPMERAEHLEEWLSADQEYDVCLCDYEHLPFNGGSIRYLREQSIQTPVVALHAAPRCCTTREAWSRIRAHNLDCGMDDVILKPATVEEVTASLRAVFRRSQSRSANRFILRYGEHTLSVDIHRRAFWLDGREKPLPLTSKQTELLLFLASAPNRAFSKVKILEALYGYGKHAEPESNCIQVQLLRIRKLLGDEWSKGFIETIRGYGYRLNAE